MYNVNCKAILLLISTFMSLPVGKCWLQMNDDYCFVRDDQRHLFYNKYTPYEFIYYNQGLGTLPDECVPIQFTMISRSGHHFPCSKTIKEINDVVAILKNSLQKNKNGLQLCPEDIDLLASLSNNIDENMAKKLTPQGRKDIINMAKRKKQEFSEIFNRPYSPDFFKFIVDGSVDSKESATAFAQGLYDSINISIEETDSISLQQSKKTCLGFQPSEEITQRYNNFFNGDVIANSVSNINKRLGFINGDGLTKEQMIILFKACGFDASRDLTTKSLFCVPFTPHDLQVFDYLEDLSRYYIRYVLNEEKREKLASPLILDIFNTFNKIVSQGDTISGGPIGTFYFPHWGVKNSFMAAIGLINVNYAMNPVDYNDCDNRQFKSSQVDPYSSNIDLILYQCKRGEKYRVMIRLQEKPITQLMEGSDGSGLYSWDSFSRYLQNLFTRTTVDQTTPEFTKIDLNQITVPRNKVILPY